VSYEVVKAGHLLIEQVAIIANTNAKTKVYKDLSVLVDATTQQRTELEGFLLKENDTSAFLTTIENIGSSQHVALTTDSLKVVENKKSFNQLVIQFGMEGRVADVEKMLTIFETIPYHSVISVLKVTKSDNGFAESSVELMVTLDTHDS
jgi:hypothetical protein